MALYDLGGHIGDEGLLLDLVDGQDTVQGLLTAEVLHVGGDVICPKTDSVRELGLDVNPWVMVPSTASLRRNVAIPDMLPNLGLHPSLVFLVDVVRVVVVIVDGVVLNILDELVQLLQGGLAPDRQGIMDHGRLYESWSAQACSNSSGDSTSHLPNPGLEVFRGLVVQQV